MKPRSERRLGSLASAEFARVKCDRVRARDFRRGRRALVCDVNEKGLQKKFIVPLVVSELAPAESSEPEVAQERE